MNENVKGGLGWGISRVAQRDAEGKSDGKTVLAVDHKVKEVLPEG